MAHLNAADDFCCIPEVDKWLKAAEQLNPSVRDQFRYAVNLHAIGETKAHPGPMEQFLTSYSQLRDWASLPCVEIANWAESVVKVDKRLRTAFGPMTMSTAILDQETVAAWFRRAVGTDKQLCRMIAFEIQREAAGGDPSEAKMQLLRPSFLALSAALTLSCQPLAEFLGEPKPTMVDLTGPSNPLVRLPMPEVLVPRDSVAEFSGTANPPPQKIRRRMQNRAYVLVPNRPKPREPTEEEAVRKAIYAAGRERGEAREYYRLLAQLSDRMWTGLSW